MNNLTSATEKKKNIKGNWSIVQWVPDIATEETHNIGIVLDVENDSSFRFLDTFDRVKCLYDENTVMHLQDVIELTHDALGVGKHNFSDQIKLINKGITKGRSLDEILDRLYLRAISLAKPHVQREVRRDSFSIVRNDDFVKRVPKKIREQFIKSNDRDLANLFPVDQYIDVLNNRLKVPIRSNSHYGSITSVVTTSINTINTNYLMAATDLLAAAKGDAKIPTFFVLTPAEDELAKLDKSKVDQIDLTIDRLNFKMEQQDVKLICESSEDLLVDKMKFWAKEVA